MAWKEQNSTTFASSASFFSAKATTTVAATDHCAVDTATTAFPPIRPLADAISNLSFSEIMAKIASLAKAFRHLSKASHNEEKQRIFAAAADYLEKEQDVISNLRETIKMMSSIKVRTPSTENYLKLMRECLKQITILKQENTVDEPTTNSTKTNDDYIVFHLKGLSCLSNSENEGTDPKTKAVKQLLINFASLVESGTPGLKHCKTEEEARKVLAKHQHQHKTGDKGYFTLRGGIVKSVTVSRDGVFTTIPIKTFTTNEHNTTPYRTFSPRTTA